MGQGLSRTPVRRLPVIVQRIEQRNDRLEAWDMAAPASWLPCPRSSPGIAVQRCWAHKIRNVLDKVKKADQPAVKRALHKIMNAPNAPAARAAARKFANRFEDKYPAAVACLRNDLDELLTCFRYKSQDQRRKVRTTNAIERRFREVRRRTRPMGTFQDRTSMDRILFAVFIHENKSQGVSTPFLLTQNN